MTSTPVVTRFAPSPTGALHVGGARTALFNWAFARRHGGQFILRIEDTDKARSTPESTAGILRNLKWLGIDWDQGPEDEQRHEETKDPPAADRLRHEAGAGGPYFQSQRLDLYRAHLARLLDSGRAYKCFKTPQELGAQRQRARAEKRAVWYDPTESRSLSADQIAQYEKEGRPHVVRFLVPPDPGVITVEDDLLGAVSVNATEVEDFVILKSDGYPTYHFAVVVDDALMGVTHVIRGQEHLNNAAKHVLLQDALGFERPHYVHVPLIFNADGSKMSKRDKAKAARQAARTNGLESVESVDAASFEAFMKKKSDDLDVAVAVAQRLNLALPEIDVSDFRASGYLPQVVCNYIALLGWSPGNDLERFDNEFLKTHFGIEGLNKSNARFDRQKLVAFNADTIADLAPDEFRRKLWAQLERHRPDFLASLGDRFNAFADAYHLRSPTLDEPVRLGRFFVLADDAIEYDPAAVKKVLRKNNNRGLAVLADLKAVLERCETWNAEALESSLKAHAADNDLKMGDLAQPLRVAVSGSTVSPPIFETLAILGRDSTLARIDRCLLHEPLHGP